MTGSRVIGVKPLIACYSCIIIGLSVFTKCDCPRQSPTCPCP
nr:MAG TPA: Dolichol-phosphate mannosyltransferase subunit [Microviridae sp.]